MSDEPAGLVRLVTMPPTDYTPWGSVERWEDPSEVDGDCSSGCRHARPLDGHLGADWVVCTREDAPRAGLLTFEHQAGRGCFEAKGRRTAKAQSAPTGAP